MRGSVRGDWRKPVPYRDAEEGASGGLPHSLRLPPSAALSLALRRIARPFLTGNVCDRGNWGDRSGVRSVEPIRVGQQPAIVGGGRSWLMLGAIQHR